jgi:hypothetical protein
MNIKVKELIKIYNFYIGYFFIWQSGTNIVYKIYISTREIYNICEQYYYHYIRWTNNQNKSCRSWKVIELCSWQLFYLN